MTLHESAHILNNSADEIKNRLTNCLYNLRGPVPESTNNNGAVRAASQPCLTSDLERCAGKLADIMNLVGELSSLAGDQKSGIAGGVLAKPEYR